MLSVLSRTHLPPLLVASVDFEKERSSVSFLRLSVVMISTAYECERAGVRLMSKTLNTSRDAGCTKGKHYERERKRERGKE